MKKLALVVLVSFFVGTAFAKGIDSNNLAAARGTNDQPAKAQPVHAPRHISVLPNRVHKQDTKKTTTRTTVTKMAE